MEPQDSKDEVAATEATTEATTEVATPEVAAPTYSFPEATFSSLDEIDVSSYPEEVQEHLTKIVNMAAERAADITSARESYEAAKDRMMNLVSHMEASDGRDAGSLVEHIDQQNSAIDMLLSEVTTTAFSAFTRMHPELSSLPINVRKEVETQFSGIGTRFTNGNTLEQMEEAYNYALYRTNWRPQEAEKTATKTVAVPTQSTVTQQKPSPVVEKISNPGNVDARKQSVVADGSVATTTPRRDVNEMSWDELLNRNLHLIS